MPSNIEWTDETWNPVTGCNRVSPGCDNCYMFREWPRFQRMHVNGYEGEPDVPALHYQRLDKPIRMLTPKRIFVCSMSDLFNSHVPFEFITQVFATMAVASQHTFQVLTKRPGRMSYFANEIWPKILKYRCRRCNHCWFSLTPHGESAGVCSKCTAADYFSKPNAGYPNNGWPSNVWAGTSLEQEYDGKRRLTARLDLLAQVPATVRFVSYEPALGPVDLRRWLEPQCTVCRLAGCVRCDCDTCIDEGAPVIDWVIAGGESGGGARAANPDWFRMVRDHCIVNGIPFFFKQWGSKADIQTDRRIAELDGQVWNAFPEISAEVLLP